jgi:hypothetical protein
LYSTIFCKFPYTSKIVFYLSSWLNLGVMASIEEKDDVDGEEIAPTLPPPTQTPSTQQPQTYLAEDGTLYYWDGAHSMWLPQVEPVFYFPTLHFSF